MNTIIFKKICNFAAISEENFRMTEAIAIISCLAKSLEISKWNMLESLKGIYSINTNKKHLCQKH